MHLRHTFFLLLLSFALGSGVAQAKQIQLKHQGLTVNAELVQAEGSKLADGVVLMVHGTLAHGQMEIMKGLQNVFQEYGVNSLAINLSLGLDNRHGMYDCKVTHKHQHTDALDEINLWFNWLKQQGARQVTLLGHSRGGNQAAWFAVENNDPVLRRVVLVAPQTWSPEYARKDYKKRYQTELQPLLDKAQQLVKQGKGDTLMENIDFIYCEDTEVTAKSFVNYYQPDMRKDTPTLLSKINEPVLVFAGTRDMVVKGLENKVAPLADDDKIKLVVIEGANHMFRDLYLYDIADNIEAFIEQHP